MTRCVSCTKRFRNARVMTWHYILVHYWLDDVIRPKLRRLRAGWWNAKVRHPMVAHVVWNLAIAAVMAAVFAVLFTLGSLAIHGAVKW